MYKSIFIILSLSLFSCIEFKSDYPETTYYKLSEEDINLETPKFDGGILIKDISLPTWVNIDYLTEYKENNIIERYYYHKWSNNLKSQVHNLIKNRLISQNNFSKGVVNFSSKNVAKYILEIDILDLVANDEDNGNLAYIKSNIKVYSNNNSVKEDLLLNKVYKFEIERSDDELNSIPLDYGILLAKLTDTFLNDMKKAVN